MGGGQDLSLKVLLQAQNLTGPAISGFKNALSGLSQGMQYAAVAALAFSAAVIGIGVAAVNNAMQYESAMTQLQNTTNSSNAQMQQYKATIRSLSDATGKSQIDLAQGMYQIISANFAGADATRILTTATQAAIIANANQTQVTTGLVVTLNAFKLKASEVDKVSNQMFKTLSLGRGYMGDLAGALQTGGALVAHYGVSVTDMDATLATLSTGGMKTFGTSMTGLTQLLNVMDGKTTLIATRLHKLGITFDQSKFSAMSYTQQIAYLTRAFQGHEKQMVSVLGSKQAATALGILGTQSALFATNLKKLGDAHTLAQEKADAWARTQKTAAFQLQVLKTNVLNLLTDLGTALLPVLVSVTGAIHTMIFAFVNWIQHNQTVQSILHSLGTGFKMLGNAAGAVAGFFQHNAAAMAVLKALAIPVAGAIGGLLVAGFIALAIAAWGAAAGVIAATWPFLAIGAAVAVLIAIIALLVTHWTQVTQAIGGLMSWLGSHIGAAFSAIGTTIQRFIGWWTSIPNRIKAILLGFVIMLIQKFEEIRAGGIQKVIALVTGAVGWFLTLPIRVMAAIATFIVNLLERFGLLNSQTANKIKSIITTIATFFESLPGKALQWMADFIAGIVHGIMNGIGQIGNAVGNIGNTIKSILHFSKPDIGPLANFDTWMPDMMDLMTKGIIAGNPKLQAAVNVTARTLAGAVPSASSGRSGYGTIPYGRPPISGGSSTNHYGGDTYHIELHAPNAKDAQDLAKKLAPELAKINDRKMNRNGTLRQTAQGTRNS